jgi:hypothetical protein
MFKNFTGERLNNSQNGGKGEDMVPLLVTEVSFQTVMKTLAKHFKLKQEKEKEDKPARNKKK